MKIGMVSPRYHPDIGGVETHVKELSENFTQLGIEVDVLTTTNDLDYNTSEIINGVNVKKFFAYSPNDAYFFSLKLLDYLKKNSNRYDIVHAHNYHAFPSLFASLSKTSNSFVFTPHYHGKGHSIFRNILHIPYRYFAQDIFKESDIVISVSEFEKRLILKNFNVDENNIKVIPNGIKIQEYKMIKRDKNHKLILSVGRLEEYKGMHHIIKIMPRLSDEYKLIIVGKGSYKKHLMRSIKENKVESRVTILENLEKNELLQLYSDADVFILLSSGEAYGITVAESLASGTPCIVSNESGLRDWVNNISCWGLDLPVDYTELISLVTKISTLRVSAHGIMDWKDIASMTLDAYNEII